MRMDIKALNEEIKKRGHSWIAEENHMTKLSSEQQQSMMGVLPSAEQLTDDVEVHQADTAPLPPFFDWRNGGGYVTGVKDQGLCGSCVGFACTAVLESMIAIEHHLPHLYDLSAADSFFCSSHGTTCEGWHPHDCFNANRLRGVVPESLFPYWASQPITNGPRFCIVSPNRDSLTFQYSTISQVNGILDTKSYLVNKGPITACFDLYADFYGYQKGIYKYTSGKLLGSHCVSIIGYDDNNGDGYWVCKNSWGTEWGIRLCIHWL